MAIPTRSLFRLILTAALCTGFYLVGFYQNFRGNISLPPPLQPSSDTTECDFPNLFPQLDFFPHHFAEFDTSRCGSAGCSNGIRRRVKRYRRNGGPFGGAATTTYQKDLRN